VLTAMLCVLLVGVLLVLGVMQAEEWLRRERNRARGTLPAARARRRRRGRRRWLVRRPADHELPQRSDGALVIVRRGASEYLGERRREARYRDGFLRLHGRRGGGTAGAATASDRDGHRTQQP
jgi:hypothetical protein